MTPTKKQNSFNMSVIIENIKFDIIDISQETQHQTISYNMRQSPMFPTRTEIKIIAKTETTNYRLLSEWFDKIQSSKKPNYKKDISFGAVQILGVYPIDYTFNNYHIDVTLSADLISGDLKNAYLIFQRKEKLKKISNSCET